MEPEELALELLRLYLEHSRERIDFEKFVEMYVALLSAIKGMENSSQPSAPPPQPPSKNDDKLFDFKEPLSLSEKI